MKINRIIASAAGIRFELDGAAHGDKEVLINAYVPLIDGSSAGSGRYPGRLAASCTAEVRPEGNSASAFMPSSDEYELFICRFEIISRGQKAGGVCFVTDFEEGYPLSDDPGPEVRRPIGTWMLAPDEDVEYMRFGCMMDEIDEVWLMTADPKPDDIEYVWNGKKFYFDREMVGIHDSFLSKLAQKGIPTLIRFINRRDFQLKKADREFFDILKHPGYEEDFEGVEISAVNLRTEAGLDHFCACLDFIFRRYASPDSPYGWSTRIDIGNEINSQRVWHNAGPMRCEDFMEEYSVALRLAALIAGRYNTNYRANVSLEMNFTRLAEPDPTHYYPARDCLMHLVRYTRRDGDFDWGVSAHPYPENLNYPDFYNDRNPVFSFDTSIITMKNLEVWPALLSQPEFQYRGRPRRVLFDEQGFNTRDDAPYTEEQGAYAFVLAYLKIRRTKGIEMFLIHRHADLQDSDEYGLHLGLRCSGGYTDELHLFPEPGRRKLICHAIAAMDTESEGAWVRAARNYIGEALFDSLLNAPAVDRGSMKEGVTLI